MHGVIPLLLLFLSFLSLPHHSRGEWKTVFESGTTAIPGHPELIAKSGAPYLLSDRLLISAHTVTDNKFSTWLLEYEDSTLGVIVDPGSGFPEGKALSGISPDGERVVFKTRTTNPDENFRPGIYLREDNTILKIADNTSTWPDSADRFFNIGNLTPTMGADGSVYFIAENLPAGTTFPGGRKALFRYTRAGELVKVVEQGDEIEGIVLVNFRGGLLGAGDGSIIFNDGIDHLFAYRNDALVKLASRSDDLPIYPRDTFLVGGELYVQGRAHPNIAMLFRIPLDGGDAVLVHEFDDSHPLGLSANLQYFDIRDRTVLMADHATVVLGSVDDLSGNRDSAHPWTAFFGEPEAEDGDLYLSTHYGWFHSTKTAWPWVLSYKAGQWMYVAGNTSDPLVGYVKGIGWTYSTPVFWPWYYDYGHATWRSFHG